MRFHTALLFTYLCLQSILSVSAQSESITVGVKADGTDLKASSYTFAQRVESFAMSDKADYLCINFRETSKNGKYLKNKGEIGFYDIANRKLLWKQPINYFNTKTTCLQEGVLMTNIASFKVSLFDKEDGSKRWETGLFPIHTDDSLGVLLGYANARSSKLRAVDMKSGKELWNNKIEHNYGWNQVLEVEGSHRLIVADELHKLDFATGRMQTLPGSTGVFDTKAALLQGLVAVAGAATGAAVSGGSIFYGYVPSSPNAITSLTSNVVSHRARYYWADRKQVSCIDSAMNVVWETKFEDVKAASSRLFIEGDKLYMVSYGFGLREGGSRKKYGRPFIACYNLSDGKEVFFNQLSMKKDIIEDAARTDDALFMLFDDGLAYQALTDSVVNIVPWDVAQYGKLCGILPNTVYIANANRTAFRTLDLDNEYCLVYNEKSTIYEIDKELHIRNTYKAMDVYSPVFRLKDYLCIGNGSDYRFIHEMGMPVAHLHIPFAKGAVSDNKLLLLTYENKLLYLDLDEAIN